MNSERRLSAPVLLALYAVAVFLLVLASEYLFPATREPLKPFYGKWRFEAALILYIKLFPALVLSAVCAHFAFGEWGGGDGERFSSRFLDSMTAPFFAAVLGAAIYALLFLFALPSALDGKARMEAEASLFKVSAASAEQAVKAEDWEEAARALNICDQVWRNSPLVSETRKAVIVGVAEAKTAEAARLAAASEIGAFPTLAGVNRNTSAAEAVELARKALERKSYYDAHWLATFAQRLAKPQAPEREVAARIAAEAWNAIVSLTPSEKDAASFSVFARKREGYAAVVAEDWIRAYYIFEDLSRRAKDDPDVVRYFALSAKGAKSVAFFADEVGASMGGFEADLLLSLPREDGGREVLRFKKLYAFADSAYGEGLEAIGFGPDGRVVRRVEAPLCKIIPQNDSKAESHKASRVSILLLALDRQTPGRHWEPKWLVASKEGQTRWMADVSFADFSLAVKARRGAEALSIPDLMKGERSLTPYGFLAEGFRAEALRRIVEPFAFLSLCIFLLAMAWRLRAPNGAGVLGFIMLGVLPFALDTAVQAYRLLAVSTSALFAVLMPFEGALAAVLVLQAGLLCLALVFLAGQRG